MLDAREGDRRDEPLQVLIANEKHDRLRLLAAVVQGLGHEVTARSISVSEVAATTARERPGVALVGLGESSEHARELISEIVREAYCPVIAILSAFDALWVNEAAKRSVFAYIVAGHPEELQSAIDITLRRFADVLAALERAKAVVTCSLEELKRTGLSTEQLIRDASSHD